MFASALGTIVSRNAAFSWNIEGDAPRTAARMHEVLENADNGRGWLDLVSKVSFDLYTQDTGAFIEIVRQQDRPDSPVIGLNHLDAWRCWHTGIPEAPVLYQDRLGRWHLLKWYNVIPLAELPTPIETYYGLQLCALTRLLRATQIIKNISQLKYEKTGGRHTRALHVIRGLATSQINEALEQMRTFADSQGLTRYMQPLVVGTIDPAVDLQTATLDFVSLPDGYDEETTFKHYVSQIALAFFEDYQSFAPLPGGNLGTSAQSEVLARKSRGKGPELFRKLFSFGMNQKVMPKNVEFLWQEQDPDAEKSEAEIKKLRAEERAVRIQSGELTPAVARKIAHDAGDLEDEYLAELGEEDSNEEVALEDDRPTETQVIDEEEAALLAGLAPPEQETAVVPPELAALGARAVALVTRRVSERSKTQLGAFLQTRIHRAFTTAADDLAALGYMDTAGRIQLSNIIGDSLRLFAELMDAEAAETALRELDREDVRELVEHAKALSLEELNDDRVELEAEVGSRLAPLLARIRRKVRGRLNGRKEIGGGTKPYSGPGDPGLPAGVRKLPAKKRRQWVAVFNGALEDGDDEGEAFRKANGTV